jgi:hypothetical protein
MGQVKKLKIDVGLMRQIYAVIVLRVQSRGWSADG